MRIRRQVYELSLTDLGRNPVWEFALDEEGEEGQDEATVRPYKLEGALDPSQGMFVVRASFDLADGTQMQGYLTPPVDGDSSIGTLQPIIVTDRGQVIFWCGVIEPSREQMEQSYSLLRQNAASVFPVRFESAVPMVGGVVKGSILGFLVLEDWQSGKTRTIV